MQFFRTLTAAGFLAAAATAPVAAAEISGAGSSFAYPIYAKWIEAYKKETGIAVDYRSVGSADGIREVRANAIPHPYIVGREAAREGRVVLARGTICLRQVLVLEQDPA